MPACLSTPAFHTRRVKLQRSLNTFQNDVLWEPEQQTFPVHHRERDEQGIFMTSGSLCLGDHGFTLAPLFSHSTSGLLHVHFHLFFFLLRLLQKCACSHRAHPRGVSPPASHYLLHLCTWSCQKIFFYSTQSFPLFSTISSNSPE